MFKIWFDSGILSIQIVKKVDMHGLDGFDGYIKIKTRKWLHMLQKLIYSIFLMTSKLINYFYYLFRTMS